MYREMYSRFRDAIKSYTQRLDIDERSFMALLTEGINIFQRETEIWEKTIILNKISNSFYVPSDMIRPRVILTDRGVPISPRDIQQIENEKRRHEYHDEEERFRGHNEGEEFRGHNLLYSIYGNKIILHSKYDGNILFIRYIPNYESISYDSNYWNVWSPVMVVGIDLPVITTSYKVLNGQVIQTLITYNQGQIFISDGTALTTTTGYASYAPQDLINTWYFTPNFMNVFTTQSVPRVFKQFKAAFLDYAKGEYLHSLGMINQADYFYKRFLAEAANAKQRKLDLYSHGELEYINP